MRDDLLDAEALAKFCGVPIKTVYEWNTKGTGPRRVRVGRHVRYRRQDVEAWLDQRYADDAEVPQ
jgi:excisionase family DNA binding protein